MGRAMDAGQRVATLATFLPVPWGPASTRALKWVARRIGHTPEGIEGPVGRIIAERRTAGRPGLAGGRAASAGPDRSRTYQGQNADRPGSGTGPDPASPGDLLDRLLAARVDARSPL